MQRILGAWVAVLVVAGCSSSKPVDVRRVDAPGTASTEGAEEPIQPKLTPTTDTEPKIEFESPEAETVYWQDQCVKEIKKRFANLSESDVQKNFDELSPQEQANIRRIRTWLPHKRIMEMGNAGLDVVTIANHPTQFEVELAIRRLLEFADDSGAPVLMKNLGITKPKMMVMFRLDFGQISPELQSLVWGIHQKLRERGIAGLDTAERALLQNRPGLFPRIN